VEETFRILAGMVIPLGITLYSLNYIRWMWRRGARRGAAGAFLITVSMVVVSLFSLWRPWE
jgi:hypothetical protein